MPDRLDKLTAIHQIDESLLTILDVDKLLRKVLHIMKHTFGFDTAVILLYDEKSKELYIRAATGCKREVMKRFRMPIGGPGIIGHVAQTQQPLHIPNLTEDSRYAPGINTAKSAMAFPLLINEQRLLGVLALESQHEYAFTDDDFETLCQIAAHVSLALHNALLFEQERKKTSQLMLIHKIRQRISVNLGLDKLLQIVVQSLVEFFSYYQVLIFTYHESEDQLHLIARAGLEDILPNQTLLTSKEAYIITASFHQNKVILIRNPAANSFPTVLFPHAQSELALPIIFEHTPIGVLYIASRDSDAFDQKDVHILRVISEQLSALIKDVVDLSKILKKTKHFEIIHKIGQVAVQTFELKKFLHEMVHLIQDTFGYYQVAFLTYEKASQQLELAAYAGEAIPSIAVGSKLSIKEGISGFAVRSGKYYLCNDVTQEPKYREVLANTKSELAMPVVFENQVLGVLDIESAKLNQFEPADVTLFAKIAEQIACTIVNAELYQQKTFAHNLLLNLNNLGREIYTTFDLQKIFTIVIRKLPAYTGCRLCSIFFYYPERNELVLMAHTLPDVERPKTFALSEPENILMTKVISLRRSLHVTDIEQELGIPKRPRYETKSFLNILLQDHDRIIGILNLTDKLDHHPFSAEEFYLIHSFSEHLTNAIVNSEKYQEILELSVTDGLTGLFVHRFFQETLEKEIAQTRRHQRPLALILIDFDNFKQCNDHFGHQIGDIVLRETAVLIRKEIREYDIACRYGGEEFGIILPSTSLSQAKVIAERLRQKIAMHAIEIGDATITITVSQGVSEYDSATDKDTLIRQADLALLKAKNEGKNRVVTHLEAADVQPGYDASKTLTIS